VDRAGVARTTIHRRFATREALIEALAASAVRQTAEKVEAAVDVLAEYGPTLGRPLVDTLVGSKLANLKELRPRQTNFRVLFVRATWPLCSHRQATVIICPPPGPRSRTTAGWSPPTLRRPRGTAGRREQPTRAGLQWPCAWPSPPTPTSPSPPPISRPSPAHQAAIPVGGRCTPARPVPAASISRTLKARILKAEWTKLRTLPSTWRTAALTLALGIGFSVAVALSQISQWHTMTAQQRNATPTPYSFTAVVAAHASGLKLAIVSNNSRYPPIWRGSLLVSSANSGAQIRIICALASPTGWVGLVHAGQGGS
jgi:hypothetical protein